MVEVTVLVEQLVVQLLEDKIMRIINAIIPADLCEAAIEESLLKLKPKNIEKVILLVSSSYSFHYIFTLFGIYNDEIDNINTIGFPLKNVDSSEVLETDSWMLIDYDSQTMYYSEGA